MRISPAHSRVDEVYDSIEAAALRFGIDPFDMRIVDKGRHLKQIAKRETRALKK